jgi:hypothetical protein
MSAQPQATSFRARLRSPRFQARIFWTSMVVLVAGIIAFLVAFVGNTGTSLDTPLSDKPAKDVSSVPPTVKLPADAKKVAREFILTAVARENLPRAYALSGPLIRQGMTLKEWNKGAIPVVPYPGDAIDYAPMKVDYSYPKEALVEVALLPKKGYKIKPQIFFLTLIKVGNGENVHWLVNGWVPRGSPQVPNGSANNGAGG